MRKGLLVLILFSLTLSLFASEIYKSNELGQKLSLESSIGQEGYFLEVDGAVETLYLDGSVYLTIYIALILFGLVIGILGSLLAMRRYLRV